MKNGGVDYRDEARLEHMMRGVVRVNELKAGLERSMLREGDNQTELILYNLQIIGEAANNVSKEVCEQHPEIDFSGWAGLRHKLVHDYANIDFDIVWNAICSDLPILESALKPLVDALPKVPELPDNIGTFL